MAMFLAEATGVIFARNKSLVGNAVRSGICKYYFM